MENATQFLNHYNGALTLLFTAVVAGATVAYVVLTRALVRETARLRAAQTTPTLSAFVVPEERWVNLLDLVLRNHGQGAAYDIEWVLVGDEQSLRDHGVPLPAIQSRRFSYLPPGEQLRFHFGTGPNLLKEPPMTPFEISVSYKDVERKTYRTSVTIDIEQYRGMMGLTPPEYDMAKALTELSRAIRSVIGMGHLNVATITDMELEEQMREGFEESRK